nr:cathepsin G-like [Zootoca vivipara]
MGWRLVFCTGTGRELILAITDPDCCFVSSSGFNTVVVLGAHDLWANESAQEHYLVEQAYQHENFMFQNNTFSNDILLLKLLSKVRLSKNIQPLPLPTSSRDLSEGTLCSVAGWSPYQDDCKFMLYEANASIYDRSKCQKFYPKIDYGKICAGNREDDSQLFIQVRVSRNSRR